MAKPAQPTVVIVAEDIRISTGEFCRCCDLAAEQLFDMVSEGMLQPEGGEPGRWRFSQADLARARTALRLQRDLGLNLAGAALAVQLLEDVHDLRSRVRVLEQLLR